VFKFIDCSAHKTRRSSFSSAIQRTELRSEFWDLGTASSCAAWETYVWSAYVIFPDILCVRRSVGEHSIDRDWVPCSELCTPRCNLRRCHAVTHWPCKLPLAFINLGHRIETTLITRSVNTLLCSRRINRSITRTWSRGGPQVPHSSSSLVPRVPKLPSSRVSAFGPTLAIMIYRILINLKCLNDTNRKKLWMCCCLQAPQ